MTQFASLPIGGLAPLQRQLPAGRLVQNKAWRSKPSGHCQFSFGKSVPVHARSKAFPALYCTPATVPWDVVRCCSRGASGGAATYANSNSAGIGDYMYVVVALLHLSAYTQSSILRNTETAPTHQPVSYLNAFPRCDASMPGRPCCRVQGESPEVIAFPG
jgi:hypothetical protein